MRVPRPKHRARGQPVSALGPGVRIFMTCYDAEGAVVEWGRPLPLRRQAVGPDRNPEGPAAQGPLHADEARLAPHSGDSANPR